MATTRLSPSEPTGPWPAQQVLGAPIASLTMSEVLDIVDQRVDSREPLLLGVVNAAKLVNMRRDVTLREAVLESDLILADGMSVVWASHLLPSTSGGLPERVPGIDLMHGMLERGSRRRYRVYLLGARDEVVDISAATIEQMYPGVRVVGRRNGYFRSDQEEEIVGEIRASRADLLFVAMSPPKKEVFLARWHQELGVPVCHGVGGAFDVLAGKTRRAPPRWQRWGLEWLYRILQEPGRMWRRYLVTNTYFCAMVLREMIRRRSRRNGGRSGTPNGRRRTQGSRPGGMGKRQLTRAGASCDTNAEPGGMPEPGAIPKPQARACSCPREGEAPAEPPPSECRSHTTAPPEPPSPDHRDHAVASR
ncbi:MAG: WecB/TagA/CpsF family glycosyltransferase [Phycisphaerae bacterium]